jgi:UDP-glucose 4-epimerase
MLGGIRMKKIFEGLRVLVTGGAGFVGSHLVETLINTGASVIVLDDLSTGKMENIKHVKKRFEIVIDDVRKRNVLEKIGKVDIIFHEAARALLPSFEDPNLDLQVNAGGTINILEMARKCDARVIHASSGSVYGNPIELPISENHPLNPISPYGASKLTAEIYCNFYFREYSLFATCLRYFNVYGPRQAVSEEMGVIPIFIAKVLAEKNPVIFGDGKQTRDFTHVSDVVNANLLAATTEKAKGKIVNIGTGTEISILNLASMILKLCKSGLDPAFSDPKPGDIRRLVANISLAKEIIGYEPKVLLKKGILDYMSWYKQTKC